MGVDGSNMEISNPIYMKDYDDEEADGFSFDGDKVRLKGFFCEYRRTRLLLSDVAHILKQLGNKLLKIGHKTRLLDVCNIVKNRPGLITTTWTRTLIGMAVYPP